MTNIKKSTKNPVKSVSSRSKAKKAVATSKTKVPSKTISSAHERQFILLTWIFAIGRFFKSIGQRIAVRARGLLARRPHRSFYLTPRRDAKRSLKIDGYFHFSGRVWRMLWKNRWLFTKFFLLYGVFSFFIIGLASQENFAAFRDAINGADGYEGLSKWLSLFSNAVTGSSSSTVDASQQIMAGILILYGWLTMVWLLRALMREEEGKIKLRDGVYSAGSPILSTFVVVLVIVLQLLPFALVLIAYTSITSVGWINTGVAIENMAAWCAMAVAGVLTLYWITSSLIALIIVTLPGTYPFVAIRAASDLIIGRRLKLLFRLLFMMLPIAAMWLLVLMPAILIDSWLKLTWQPLVPIVVFILGVATIMWVSTYIYMLYRKIVDDPAPSISSRRLERIQNKEARTKVESQKKAARSKRKVNQSKWF